MQVKNNFGFCKYEKLKEAKTEEERKRPAILYQLIVSNETVKVREILWAFTTA